MKVSKRKIKESITKKLKEINTRTTYLRPFKSTDWNAYAGANNLPNGQDPMIYEDPDYEFTVILSGSDDGNNCVITVLPNEVEEYVYYTPTDVDASIAEANHIIYDLLEDGGDAGYITGYLRDPESGFERVM